MRTLARVTFGIVSVGFAMLVTVSSSISARQRPDSSRLPDAGWKFIARPVRASSEKCLRCHSNKVERGYPAVTSTTQIDDALAAVLYGYRPLR